MRKTDLMSTMNRPFIVLIGVFRVVVDAVEVDVFEVIVLSQQLEAILIVEDISAHRGKTGLLEGRHQWSRRARNNRWWR